jgi:ribosomal protein S18 acetylase RimI-like enzyme
MTAAQVDPRAGGRAPAVPLVRRARGGDNEALLELAASCPMEGDVSLCVTRAPDFFALNRVEGDRCDVAVAEGVDAKPIGCVALAERYCYLGGRPARTLYVGDLKVHPAHRRRGIADALARWAYEAARVNDGQVPVLATVLAGNRAMERRADGHGAVPPLRHFATLRAHAVPLLRRRVAPGDGPAVRVRRATPADVAEMAELWARVAPGRNFAPVLDAEALARWVDAAPGLSLGDYLVATGRGGRIAGFVALWDQSAFKQLRVVGYSPRLAAFRVAFNALAPAIGATRLPPPGAPLRCRTATHLCVPAGEAGVLRALLLHARDELRGAGYSFFAVGLDRRDPLAAALAGLWAQPTDVRAYVTTAAGGYAGPPLDDRPLHHEIALV